MLRVTAATFALVIGLLAGSVRAGDVEVMAMRGNPPDGSRPINLVSRVSQGGMGEKGTHAPAVTAASRVEEPEGVAASAQFFRWRNNCAQAPGIVAGRSVVMDAPAGFGLTPRFVERPEKGGSVFFRELLKGLASERDGGNDSCP